MTMTDIDPDISARLAPSVSAVACPGCGRPTQVLAWGAKRWHACSPCAEAETLRRTEAERRAKALAQWEEVTPDEFRRALILPLIHPDIRPALEGDTSAGTCLIGDTGCGKTRVAYRLLHTAAMRGQSVFAVSHAAFRQAAVSRGDRDPRRADEAKALIHACRCAKALLIDDVGKGAVSEAGDEAFFELLDHRLGRQMLTHWTANSGSKWIKARFREDRGPAIIRRLRDLTPGRWFVAPPAPEPDSHA